MKIINENIVCFVLLHHLPRGRDVRVSLSFSLSLSYMTPEYPVAGVICDQTVSETAAKRRNFSEPGVVAAKTDERERERERENERERETMFCADSQLGRL
jgi:hypothetical protein